MTGEITKKIIVAIDGPAGSGKSTVAKLSAKKLGFIYVDTGALYRAIALEGIKNQIDLSDDSMMGEISHKAHIEFKNIEGENRIFLNGADVSDEIRTNEVSMAASTVSALASVRASLLGLQRKLGLSNHSVLEGRDIGTVIFPDSQAKFFITASPEERARRRFSELKFRGMGQDIDEGEILLQIKKRDGQDSQRKEAPLKQAHDAELVDTSQMTIEEVVSLVVQKVESIMKENQ